MSFAKVSLIGNLGRDPEMKYTPNGTGFCTFSMATTDKKKDRQGNMQEKIMWWRVTVWGKQAETASQYLVKGKKVYIEGRVSQDEWTDRDGKARTSLEVNCSEMQFLSNGESQGGGGYNNQPRQPQQGTPPPRQAAPAALPVDDVLGDDDIPF